MIDFYDFTVYNGALADGKQVILRAERVPLSKGTGVSSAFFELEQLHVLFELFLDFLHVQEHLLVNLMQPQDCLSLHSLVRDFLCVGQIGACKPACCLIVALEADRLQVALFAQQDRRSRCLVTTRLLDSSRCAAKVQLRAITGIAAP